MTSPAIAYEAFVLSGNIGILDRGKSKFIAASKNLLGELELDEKPPIKDTSVSGLYFRLRRIACSQVGDVIGIHPGWDKLSFGNGEKIFKVLENPPPEGFAKIPIDEVDEEAFETGINVEGLNQPCDVDIQPIVYIVWPLPGQALDKEEINFMIFSRRDIGNIELNIDDGTTNVEWLQKGERFWELAIKDITKVNEKNAIAFDVTFKDGPTVHLEHDYIVKPVPTVELESNLLVGRVKFRDGTPLKGARVCLLRAEEVDKVRINDDYKVLITSPYFIFGDYYHEYGMRVDYWWKHIPTARAHITEEDGIYRFDLNRIGETEGINGPVNFYLVAETYESNATHFFSEVFNHRGEAVNWYSDGIAGPHDWLTYHNPVTEPDVIVAPAGDNYEVIGGDVPLQQVEDEEVDIAFPYPIVWVHGYKSSAARWKGQYDFFSNPDWEQRQTVDCALSYCVDTMRTSMVGGYSCTDNAVFMEEYMDAIYDLGMRNMVAGFDMGNRPKFNLVAHSMGTPISRIWECENVGNHGTTEYYLSIAGIHGGNYTTSFWTSFLPSFLTSDATKGCTVESIRDINNSFTKKSQAKILFSWGYNGTFNSPLLNEMEPHDGVNSAPSATGQNGPYFVHTISLPESISDWIPQILEVADVDYYYYPMPACAIDMRKTWFGRLVQGEAVVEKMAEVDLTGISHSHAFMADGVGCMASYAKWLGFSPNLFHTETYNRVTDFAEWPPEHQGPLPN